MWEEALATDASDDPAMQSMQEARHVLQTFDGRRRVLGTATKFR
ncbi:hypothetical protein [Lentzea sp.]|nr:hypothetical protein [Lentzea sp.]HUQ56391.1 hypothetical protein [Lentzea sp.]